MSDPIMLLLALVRFGAARRVSLYNQLQPLLDARRLVDISTYVERARVHDRETVALEARWKAQQYAGKHNVKLAAIDPIGDRLLSGVMQVAEAPIIGLPPENPLVGRVRGMLDDVFPSGVGAITSLPYVDQVVNMEECVDKLTGEYALLVQELGMTRVVTRLAEVTRDYRAAVDAGHGRISFAEVDAMRVRGHVYLLEISSMIAGRFHDSDDESHVTARAELLAPILEHHAEVSQENRLRRGRAGNVETEVEDEVFEDGDEPEDPVIEDLDDDSLAG